MEPYGDEIRRQEDGSEIGDQLQFSTVPTRAIGDETGGFALLLVNAEIDLVKSEISLQTGWRADKRSRVGL